MLCTLMIAILTQEPRINGPDLLKTSRHISGTEDWAGYILYTACYEWVSDHELIYYTEKPSQTRAYWINLLDIRTGTSRRLDPLTKLYNEDEYPGVGGLHPSPDLRHFWSIRGGDPPQFFVTDIGGNEVNAWSIRRTGSRWDQTKQTNLTWTPDGNALIESVVDFDEGGIKLTAWKRELGSLGEPELLGTNTLNDPWLYAVWPSVASDDRYFQILQNPGADDGSTYRILSWSQSEQDSEQHTDVTFPSVAISDYQPSPDRKRILWKTTTAPSGPGSWVYEDDDSPNRPPGPHYVRLWITNLDGSNQRLLGSVELEDKNEYWDWHTFGWMRWLPGGKSVSFLFRHKLYVVDL